MSSTVARGREIVLPPVRGGWTGSLYELLGVDADTGPEQAAARARSSVLHDDDLQMALYLCYELHYASIAGVPDEMEWSPVVLMLLAWHPGCAPLGSPTD